MWCSASYRFDYNNTSTIAYNTTNNYDINPNVHTLLEIAFLKQLHKKMFDKTWRWAGEFRKSNKNIGIDWLHVATNLRQLLDDTRYQVANNSYQIDEIAARLHHRLVLIHPFPNGNGRHSRLITDLFLLANNQLRFSWGKNNLYENSSIRKEYIKALPAADEHDYGLLFKFVRS